MRSSQLCSAAVFVLLTFTSAALGIIIRHDREDEQYLKLGANFSGVCKVGRGGDGTLVAPRWVLTAGHVAKGLHRNEQARFVLLNGERYAVERIIIHPQWAEFGSNDLGLLKLDRPASGAQPIPIYKGTGELNQFITIVGHGKTGNGLSRERTEDRRRRAATNKITRIAEQHIYFTFDKPPRATDLEGAPGPGDSGGPAILFVDNKPFVVGVSSMGTNGENGPGTYTAMDKFVRVSAYQNWIEQTIRDK